MRWLGMVVLCAVASLGGCAKVDTSIANLARTLNERQVQSCLVLSGMYRPFVGATAFIATGGATLERCRGQTMPLWSTQAPTPPVVPAVPPHAEDQCPCK